MYCGLRKKPQLRTNWYSAISWCFVNFIYIHKSHKNLSKNNKFLGNHCSHHTYYISWNMFSSELVNLLTFFSFMNIKRITFFFFFKKRSTTSRRTRLWCPFKPTLSTSPSYSTFTKRAFDSRSTWPNQRNCATSTSLIIIRGRVNKYGW